MNQHTDGTALHTAEQLNAHYTRYDTLHRTNTKIATTIEAYIRMRTRILNIGVAALLLLTTAEIAGAPANYTGGAAIGIIAAGGISVRTLQRRKLRLVQEYNNNDDDQRDLINTLNRIDTWRSWETPCNPHDLQQAAEILRAQHRGPEPRPSDWLQLQLLYSAVHALALGAADYLGNAGALHRQTGSNTLLLIGRWQPLARHIYTELRADRPTSDENKDVTVCAHDYRTVVETLQQLLDTRGTDIVTTANSLAADDTTHTHPWNDLIETAAALAPA
jgi:hypothetical protein